MMKKKKFDCVAMKRRGAEIVYEQIKDMTIDEELEYWRKGTDELRKKQEELRKKKKVGKASDDALDKSSG